MSVATVWERIWWSLMLAILVLFSWLRFIDPVFPHVVVGFLLAFAAGGIYFTVGILRITKQLRREKELEENAYRELMEELEQKEVRNG